MCLLVSGPSGLNKSRACKSIEDALNAVQEATRTKFAVQDCTYAALIKVMQVKFLYYPFNYVTFSIILFRLMQLDHLSLSMNLYLIMSIHPQSHTYLSALMRAVRIHLRVPHVMGMTH